MVATIEAGPQDSEHPPLVFVHGALHGAWCWADNFLPYFADHGYRAVALDLRGHGATPADRSLRWIPLREYLDDLHAVVATLPRPPILIGHSLGGFVVQRYLEDARPAGAVLMGSTPPTGGLALTLRAARHAPVATLRAFATLRLLPLFGTPEEARYWFFSPDIPTDELHRYTDLLQEESFRSVIDTLIRPVRVRAGSAPLLVLGGADDRTATPDDVAETARRYATAPTILPDVPHDMMLDARWRTVADTILDWLAEGPLEDQRSNRPRTA